MAFDISQLGSYVQNNGKEYAMKSIANAQTAKALIDSGNVQYGVKGTAAILKLNSDVSILDGSSCGSRTGGSTFNLSNKNIVVKQLAVEDNICPNTLWNTFYATSISKGKSPQEEVMPDFADALMSERAKKIASVNEQLIWQGDTSLTGTTNLKRMDGIVKAVTGSTTATGSTMVAKLQNFYTNLDVTVRNQEDFVIAVGEDVYNEYTIALASANIYKPVEDKTLFGTTAKLFPTAGLNGTRKIVGLRWSNIQLGMDGESDAEKAELRYSIETKQWYLDFAYGLGVAVVWSDEAKYATV